MQFHLSKACSCFTSVILFIASSALRANSAAAPIDVPTRITPFLPAGYCIRWNYATNKLVYNKPGPDKYYGIYLLNPDGSGERPLTPGNPLLPGKHCGAPHWHPSGRYILFIAEKKEHPGSSAVALPGYCDMWLITPDGQKAWRLVEEPMDPDRSMLLPMFSPDGKKIAWCERVVGPNLLEPFKVAGLNVIHVADFIEEPQPHVANIKDYTPGGGPAFFEASCFTPDGRSIFMTSNHETKNFWKSQIYRLDLDTGATHRLTQGDNYNEHPGLTPDGQSIIWMTTAHTDALHFVHGTDWWLMDLDGGNPRRLSRMCVQGNPQSDGYPKWPCTVAWSPDGTWFYGDVQTNLITQAGHVVRVDILDRDQVKPAQFESSLPVVRIDSGKISGTLVGAGKDIRVFKGVPFAAPPIGALRWRPPQAVMPWEGVRPCTEFAPACPQPKVMIISNEIKKTDEDCLYLNVWAPAKLSATKTPVMVWIHGGGFTIGSASQGWFDGEHLARKGVIVVSIAYRLGPLGFLAHPLLSHESKNNVSGNYGLLDQIFALQWVQRNIAAFGGDPKNVTIFGESAGGASVCELLVSPLTKGLFQAAIAESGGARAPIRHLTEKWYGKASMEAVGTYFAEALSCAKSDDVLAAMRSKPVEDLLKAADAAKQKFGGETSGPIVDGYLLPDDPNVLFAAGKAHDVPFIAGSNADEIGGLLSDRVIRGEFGAGAEEIFKLFPSPSRSHAATVAIFTSVARADARDMSRHHSKAYLYQFSRIAPPFRFLRAFHSLEIAYVFGNLDPKLKFEPADHDLSEAMLTYWTNFAKTGDPNGPGVPTWPAYTADTDIHLELGDAIHSASGLEKAACDGMDRIRLDRVEKRKG
jgi:para-nitrobenzyl esterase